MRPSGPHATLASEGVNEALKHEPWAEFRVGYSIHLISIQLSSRQNEFVFI
jgi:hypothetical protein